MIPFNDPRFCDVDGMLRTRTVPPAEVFAGTLIIRLLPILLVVNMVDEAALIMV